MLSFVYDEDGSLILKDMPKPVPKSDGAVIKVYSCSICGTDFRMYMHGSKKITPPRVLGHEVAGVIVETGSSLEDFYPGETVAVAPAIGCGYCHLCTEGHPNMCDKLKTIGFQYDGGFAEYMEIPPDAFRMGNVNKLDNCIEGDEAALAEPIACVINAHQFLSIKEGEDVVIFGSGFIGCIHAELALRSGAGKVIMVEIVKSRAEEASKLVEGIHIISPGEAGIIFEVKKLTGGKGADVAITACSSGKAQEDAISILSKRGRLSLFGGIPGEAKGFIDSNEIHYKELSVYGVHASTPLQNRTAIELISNGSLNVKKYITERFQLKDIVKAFEAIKNENMMKAIIKP